MRHLPHSLLFLFCVVATTRLTAAEPTSLDPNLEVFRPLFGKTWKGTFKNSTPEKPVVDVMSCERALNGKAVRSLHSINDGVYGGETIYMWDDTEKKVRYHYFTTAGFMTAGTLTVEDGKWISHEKVTGSSGGVTEVRGTSEVRRDGTLHVKTEHLKDGKWEVGHEATYQEDPKARVVFR
jgi:hypothetical protein